MSNYNQHSKKQRNSDTSVHKGPTSCFVEVIFAFHCIPHGLMCVCEHFQQDDEWTIRSVRFRIYWK